ncbi:MAG: dUTP diphosphatase [Holosporaceae bacterium]|nr:MAG: dUTP diphosphatase [Holosporaceae bacterium]
MTEVPIHILPHGDEKTLPRYETVGSAGLDLPAAIKEPIVLSPGERQLIPTGFSCAIPSGHEGQIRSRSGLSWKQGIIVLNAPATIDSDHRGEIKVILINMGKEPFTIDPGMRIAQLVFAKYVKTTWKVVQGLEAYPTDRGAGGFGSTGV